MDWDYDVSTSIDGFASVVGTFDGPSGSGSGSATGLTVDLSGLADQTTAFTIRITPNRLSGTNGSAGQRAGWVDNVSLDATLTGVPATLEVEPFVEFTSNGSPDSYSIPIANISPNTSLTISSINATGSDAVDITAGPTANPATLDAIGGTDAGTIDFSFTPTVGPKIYSFDLEITSNDPDSPTFVTVDIDVAEPLIAVDQTALDFGSLANDPGAQTLTFTIDNDGGTLPLEISELNLTGAGAAAYSITDPASLPFNVAAGGSQVVEVTFNPGTQPGDFPATLEIVSDDFNAATPTIDLTASTALSANLIADYEFTGGAGDLASSDPAIGSTAADLVETDAGSRTEFGSTKSGGLVDGSAFGWSRREAPNTGLDLTLDAPTEALTFTLTPVGGYTVDLSSDGWLTVDLGAYSTLSGPTAYDVALSIDDGVSPFILGPVSGPAITGSGQEEKVLVTFDVRSLGVLAGPVTFAVMPQTTGNTNGASGQAGGYIDRITLGGQETAPPDPQLVVTSPAEFTDDGLGDTYLIPIQNLGAAALSISSVVTDGSGNASTISSINFDTPIAATGGSGNISFDFSPDAGAGLYTTNLTIISNDPGSPTTVALEITVADPEILVADTVVNFGVLPTSPGAQTLNLSVTNDGEIEDLVISGTPIAGDSEFSILTTPGAINPGNSDDLVVQFDPGSSTGRFEATLTIESNDFDDTEPTVTLTAFVDPAGTVVARYDFDPDSLAGTTADIDGSSQTDWTTSILLDEATGTGASSSSNQGGLNRSLIAGLDGDYLRFSSNRESDAQTPLASGGNDESTWTTFTVTPDSGGGEINFAGGTAVIDTYANHDASLGGTVTADWTLYYSTDGGSSWTSLGTLTGAGTTGSGQFVGPVGLSWDLSSLGNQTAPVDFILDPVSTGSTNGSDAQRGVGFDNLVVTAGSVTPGTAGFESWASGFGIPNDPDHDGDDNDGISALVEYALGLSPLVAEASPGTLAGGVLTFTKGAEAVTNGDVSYAIEESDDLGIGDAWETVTPDVNDTSEISYTLPTGQPSIFARLLVTQIP